MLANYQSDMVLVLQTPLFTASPTQPDSWARRNLVGSLSLCTYLGCGQRTLDKKGRTISLLFPNPPVFLPFTVNMSIAWLVICICAVILYLINKFLLDKAVPGPFPAGPRPWPLIGNLLDMPTTNQWETYAELCRQYGERGARKHVLWC